MRSLLGYRMIYCDSYYSMRQYTSIQASKKKILYTNRLKQIPWRTFQFCFMSFFLVQMCLARNMCRWKGKWNKMCIKKIILMNKKNEKQSKAKRLKESLLEKLQRRATRDSETKLYNKMITTEMRFIEQKCTFEAKSLLHLCWKISTRHLKYLHILI